MNGENYYLIVYLFAFRSMFAVSRWIASFCSPSKLKTVCFFFMHAAVFAPTSMVNISFAFMTKSGIKNVENCSAAGHMARLMKSIKHELKITSNVIIVHKRECSKKTKTKLNKHSNSNWLETLRIFHVERLSNTLCWALQIYQRLMIFIKRLTVFHC